MNHKVILNQLYSMSKTHHLQPSGYPLDLLNQGSPNKGFIFKVLHFESTTPMEVYPLSEVSLDWQHLHEVKTSIETSRPAPAIHFSAFDPPIQYVGSFHYERQWFINYTD